jgi:hypothetical protein
MISEYTEMPLMETAAILLAKKILSNIAGAALKPVNRFLGEKKDEFIREWGVPDPNIEETLHQTIAQGYIAAVENIVNSYLAEQGRLEFVSPDEREKQQELTERIESLKLRHEATVAPSLSEDNISPTLSIDEDDAVIEVLLATVKQDLGEIPDDLLSKFKSQLLPRIQEHIWQQLIKPSEQDEKASGHEEAA